MKSIKIVGACGLAVAIILAFQNCARSSVSGSSSYGSARVAASGDLASAPKFAVAGNVLSSISGQQIQFISVDHAPLGTLSFTDLPTDGGDSDPDGAGLSVKLYDIRSGRSAILRITYDPESFAFRGLSVPGGPPFLCHDATTRPCQSGFLNLESGRPEVNCDSPIYYSGALSGSVGDVTVAAGQYGNCE